MPTALAALVATFVATLGVTGIAATILTAVITVAATYGLSRLAMAVFGPSRPKPSDGQQEVRQAVGSRRRHYGIVHTSGQLTFLESRAGTLGKVITLGTGREGEILEHRINDQPVTVVGGTITDATFHGALHVYTRSGEDDQTAIGELTAKFAEWTADHRQRGCALAAIICDPVKEKLFSEVYNNRMPEYSQVRKGAFVYDPRLDDTAVIGATEDGSPVMGAGPCRLADRATWVWSDNGALVTADYFAHEDGYGGGFDNVNWTNIAQEADHCDAEELTIGGETIARWRIWASYSLASEERRQVLSDMLAAIDGFCWQDADGKFNLLTGRFEEPDVVITDDHILGLSATLGPKAQHRVSALKVLYTEAAIGYREQESATVSDPDVEEDPNTDPQALELYFAPHHNQAVRVGKITLKRLGNRWHLVVLLNLFGLNLLGQRFCRLESDQLGVAAYFLIDGLRLNLAEGTIEATLDEVAPEDWEFDAAEEEGTPPGAPVDDGTPVTVPVPEGLELETVELAVAETLAVAIGATWDDTGRPDLTFEAQYRPTAGGEWISMAVESEARTARSGVVNNGIEYEVRVRSVTLGGRTSGWTATATITPMIAGLVLVAKSADVAISGRSIVKMSGAAAFEPAARSATAIAGSSRLRFKPAQSDLELIVGLNAAADADATYDLIDFGLAADAAGGLQVYESGVGWVPALGVYAAGEELWVEYDSLVGHVRYYSDAGATLLRTRTGPLFDLELYVDSYFHGIGARVDEVRFDPLPRPTVTADMTIVTADRIGITVDEG